MAEKSNVLKIIKEDILRILGEQKDKKALKEFIDLEIKVSGVFLSKAFKELKKENLIKFQKEYVLLTRKGEDRAEEIIKKHFILEEYFKKTRSRKEARKIAHLLEHYISEEVLNNIKKLFTLKKEGMSLMNFQLNKEGMICDNVISDYRLFERTVSMGILPGEKIEITNKIPHGLIVKMGNKKFALDKNIVRKIKVLEYEKA